MTFKFKLKNYLYCLSASLTTSCYGLFRVNANLGMNEADFVKKNVGEQIVNMNAGSDLVVYRMYSGTAAGNLYYYFKAGKLISINEGVSKSEIIIQTP